MVSSRYLAQELFQGLGPEGQKKLQEGRVLLVGCGALGSVSSQILTRAGVGYLKIADDDQVELANLHRQLLFTEKDAEFSTLKVHAARDFLSQVNSEVEIEIFDEKLSAENGPKLADDVDLILDCSDNPEARRAIDSTAKNIGIPWIYGGVAASVGMVKFVAADSGESIENWFDFTSGSEAFSPCQDGILNTVPLLVATLQSNEALKYLSRAHDRINHNLIYFDLWENEFESLDVILNEEAEAKKKQQK